jgi:hypothetical protein
MALLSDMEQLETLGRRLRALARAKAHADRTTAALIARWLHVRGVPEGAAGAQVPRRARPGALA